MQKPSYLVHPSMRMAKTQPQTQPHPPQPNQPNQPNQIPKKTHNTQSKEFEGVRKFPRPLITQTLSKEKYIHSSETNFEDPPSPFYNYTAVESGNATSRHARPSFYAVPDNASSLRKSKINFSIVV